MYRIGDFLIQIKNAYGARKRSLSYPHSNVVAGIAEILAKEGYIKNSKLKTQPRSNRGQNSKSGQEVKTLEMELKYDGRVPAVSDIKLVSKPSVHHYVKKTGSKRSIGGHGISIVTTSRGIMTLKDAHKQNVGGELICRVF